MKDYTKGIITGASLILCFFILVSAKTQSKNLGDITVNSVTVVDKNGEKVAALNSSSWGGLLRLDKTDNNISVLLGAGENGGVLETFNKDLKRTTFVGTTALGAGGILTNDAAEQIRTDLGATGLKIFNVNEIQTSYLGNAEFGGALQTYDNEGNARTSLGTSSIGGLLTTHNANGKKSVLLGTADDGSGLLIGSTKNGDGAVFIGSNIDGGGILETTNSRGQKTAYLGSTEGGIGKLSIYNSSGKEISYLGSGMDGSGHLTTYDAAGTKTVYLGTGKGGAGLMHTFNTHGVMVGYFGTGVDEDGIAILFDRYGDEGWGKSGKK